MFRFNFMENENKGRRPQTTPKPWITIGSYLFAGALFLLGILFCSLADCAEPEGGQVSPRADAFQLNGAGELEVGFVVYGPGVDIWEVYTVRFYDRPKVACGDPDGTGRYSWFITEAMVIDRQPRDRRADPDPGRKGEQ